MPTTHQHLLTWPLHKQAPASYVTFFPASFRFVHTVLFRRRLLTCLITLLSLSPALNGSRQIHLHLYWTLIDILPSPSSPFMLFLPYDILEIPRLRSVISFIQLLTFHFPPTLKSFLLFPTTSHFTISCYLSTHFVPLRTPTHSRPRMKSQSYNKLRCWWVTRLHFDKKLQISNSLIVPHCVCIVSLKFVPWIIWWYLEYHCAWVCVCVCMRGRWDYTYFQAKHRHISHNYRSNFNLIIIFTTLKLLYILWGQQFITVFRRRNLFLLFIYLNFSKLGDLLTARN